MKVEKVINVLGLEATDKISGAKGVITSVCFDLYGCIQVILSSLNNKVEPCHSVWLDINRMTINKKRVMDLVNFENKYNTFSEVQGPAEKPIKK